MTQPNHHDQKDTGPLAVAVITVSDTRGLDDDKSGHAAAELLVAAGHQILSHVVVKDDRHEIVAAVRQALAKGAQVVVTNGGTGISARDVTYEAIQSILDKTLEGFGEAFRRLSWDEIGARSILSRAIGGTVDRAFVVALPGSTKGVRLGVEQLVIPVARHVVGLLQ